MGSAVAFLGQLTLFEGRRSTEKRAKFCILNGTLQLSIGFSCMKRLIKKFSAIHFFLIGIIFCPKTNTTTTVKICPWYRSGNHCSARVYRIPVVTRTYWIKRWQAHDWPNEEEVIMISITAPGKATQQPCVWLRLSGASRVSLYEFHLFSSYLLLSCAIRRWL